MPPPLRSPNFTLDIGLSQKKVRERCSIGRRTRVGPPPPSAISKHAPVGGQDVPLSYRHRSIHTLCGVAVSIVLETNISISRDLKWAPY